MCLFKGEGGAMIKILGDIITEYCTQNFNYLLRQTQSHLQHYLCCVFKYRVTLYLNVTAAILDSQNALEVFL